MTKQILAVLLTGALFGCLAAKPEKDEQTNTEDPKTENATPAGEDAGGEMVKVPAGTFVMGSDDGRPDEQPARKVYLDAYWIDKYEVTVSQYKKCMKAGECKEPTTIRDSTWLAVGRDKDLPIDAVNWHDAVSYCAWVGKRLPSEAEWEKAARGTNGRKYPWGNDDASCNKAVMTEGPAGCEKHTAWDVGSKEKGVSPYGAYDMSGNLFEWVSDWYDESYPQEGIDRNPKGPKTGQKRVLKGGGWRGPVGSLRASSRASGLPESASNHIGFRCAR